MVQLLRAERHSCRREKSSARHEILDCEFSHTRYTFRGRVHPYGSGPASPPLERRDGRYARMAETGLWCVSSRAESLRASLSSPLY